MSSASSNPPPDVKTHLGIIIPGVFAEIIEHSQRHPNQGRSSDIIHAYSDHIKNRAAQSETSDQAQRNIDQPQLKRFLFLGFATGGCPIIEGSIKVSGDDNAAAVVCKGYLVSTFHDDEDSAVVVIKMPKNNKLIPCICRINLIDDQAIDAIKTKIATKRKEDKRKTRYSPSTLDIETITSAKAHREGVHGHLLLTGPNKIKGRVVDTRMLTALKAGCLREGAHSQRAFYTLDRAYTVEKKNLRRNVHELVESSGEIQLIRGGKLDAAKMFNWGNTMVNEERVHHRNMNDAIKALCRDSELHPPSTI